MPKLVDVDGQLHEFPDDATDDEIGEALNAGGAAQPNGAQGTSATPLGAVAVPAVLAAQGIRPALNVVGNKLATGTGETALRMAGRIAGGAAGATLGGAAGLTGAGLGGGLGGGFVGRYVGSTVGGQVARKMSEGLKGAGRILADATSTVPATELEVPLETSAARSVQAAPRTAASTAQVLEQPARELISPGKKTIAPGVRGANGQWTKGSFKVTEIPAPEPFLDTYAARGRRAIPSLDLAETPRVYSYKGPAKLTDLAAALPELVTTSKVPQSVGRQLVDLLGKALPAVDRVSMLSSLYDQQPSEPGEGFLQSLIRKTPGVLKDPLGVGTGAAYLPKSDLPPDHVYTKEDYDFPVDHYKEQLTDTYHKLLQLLVSRE